MTALEQFLGVIQVADEPLPDQCTAYYMDGGVGACEKPDLRAHVGLGSCHCCDYFLPHDGNIVLIEETRLLEKKRGLESKYAYLNDEDKDRFVNDLILQRNQLKVYGAMLVLCRLAIKLPETAGIVQGKKHYFWLVVSGMESEDTIFFDNLRDKLHNNLQSVLTAELLDDVEILPAEILEKRLRNTPDP